MLRNSGLCEEALEFLQEKDQVPRGFFQPFTNLLQFSSRNCCAMDKTKNAQTQRRIDIILKFKLGWRWCSMRCRGQRRVRSFRSPCSRRRPDRR